MTTTTIKFTGTIVYMDEVNHYWLRARLEEFLLDLDRERLRHLQIDTDSTFWTGKVIGETTDG